MIKPTLKDMGNGVRKRVFVQDKENVIDPVLGKIRYRIQEENKNAAGKRYDVYEMLADVSKLMTIQFYILGDLWSQVPPEVKAAMPPEKVALYTGLLTAMAGGTWWIIGRAICSNACC